MIKEFTKNYLKNYFKDKLIGFLITVGIGVLIYFIFDLVWWQMLIAVASYIVVKLVWTFVFKRISKVLGLYSSAKDVYEALPDESKVKYKAKAGELKNTAVKKVSNMKLVKSFSNEH